MTPFVCNILTLFPEFFSGPLSASILARAVKAEQLEVKLINFRDEATDKHHSVDDSPYGGGAGMVLKAEPLVHALERLDATGQRAHRVLLSPQGRPFGQSRAAQLAKLDALTLICGHYEGFDERVREHFIDEEISLGDFVLTGGEPAALAILDAVVRLRPGVLGNSDSAHEESFSLDGLLEYPHYTRPYDFRGIWCPRCCAAATTGHRRLAP